MIKKILLLAAVVLPLFASAQTLKIAVVDYGTLVTNHPDYAVAMNQLKEKNDMYEKQTQDLSTELQKLQEEYEALAADTPAPIRAQKEKKMQDTYAAIQKFIQNADADMQQRQQELMTPIMRKVRDAVESVAKEKGISFVTDINGQLYYAAPVEDITTQVKAKL